LKTTKQLLALGRSRRRATRLGFSGKNCCLLMAGFVETDPSAERKRFFLKK
jgi:hypothetical protein